MRKHSILFGFALAAISACAASLVFVTNWSVTEIALWAVAVVATPVALLIPRETWSEIERMFSEKVGQLLNIFGYRSRSTGVLCAPLLS